MNTTSQSIPNPVHAASLMETILYELKKVIVGQEHLLERILVALIAEGHVLVEGAPGLAKTLTLKTLADLLAVDFNRIQFTPDLLPSDLLGTRIYNPGTGAFSTELGPIFGHFILADEINRAPAKVQSALLEAMQEKQVTIGRETFGLKAPFLVMATQNPLESEGTYPLPEAQLDRFLMKVLVNYPDATEEMVIVQRGLEPLQTSEKKALISIEAIISLTSQAEAVYLDPKIIQYIVSLVQATREVNHPHLLYGASPRGSLALAKASKALSLLRGRTYVTPEDVDALYLDCLRHRIILSYQGLAQGMTPDQVLLESKMRCNPPETFNTKISNPN
ncbi:MAG: MoxR family ATPase [Cyanobacteria bacterium]|nr:MoxR family ATPase [Cyanobacteriota bacterium]